MKVFQVSSLLPETNYFRYLASALQDAGVDITVLADCREENRRTEVKNVQLVWKKNSFYPWAVLRACLRGKPDLVHLHHETNLFGGPLTAAIFPLLVLGLRVCGFRVVTTIHATVSKAEMDTRFLETFSWPPQAFLVPPVRIFFSGLFWLVGRFSNLCIVHSPHLKSLLVEQYRIPADRLVIIPHGVPDKVQVPSQFPSAALWREKIGEDRFILYFGYFHRRKGLEHLIKAFRRAEDKNLKLVLAGGTLQEDYPPLLENLAGVEGVSQRVVFTGFVSGPELRWLLDRCQLVVLPATYSIAASGPLAQVIAHEKPVIVTRLGVYEAEIEDGVNGLLVEPADVGDLADKINLLLQDKALYKKVQKGVAKMHRERAWSRIAQSTIEIYRKVL
ncbi:glycosyltransferase family 4 protein [Candidatus Parcubacteria bacterium]|nr:glycosyltransferase family 4 protein [Candidatus Parcubacteria bacterium]